MKHFSKHSILLPRRLFEGKRAGKAVYGKLQRGMVLNTLHNPRYAVAFVYGRTRTREGPQVGRTLVRWHTRAVSFKGAETFFPAAMLAYVEKTRDQWLGPSVPGLPTFETVIVELHPQISALVPSTA